MEHEEQRASERAWGPRMWIQIPHGIDTAVQNTTRACGSLKIIITATPCQSSKANEEVKKPNKMTDSITMGTVEHFE